MPQFRKRPVVIEAVHLTEDLADSDKWPGWIREALRRPAESPGSIYFPFVSGKPVIATLEGPMSPAHGDWIIRGVKGEIYPCKADVFDVTYEPAGAAEARGVEVAALKKVVERGIRGSVVHGVTCDHERWMAVSDTFGYGSTSSMELCREYGFNPHEIVKGIQCPVCQENQS